LFHFSSQKICLILYFTEAHYTLQKCTEHFKLVYINKACYVTSLVKKLFGHCLQLYSNSSDIAWHGENSAWNSQQMD